MAVIVAANAGSSSVKLSAYTKDPDGSLMEISHAEVSALGEGSATLQYYRGGEVVKNEQAGKAGESHEAAFSAMIHVLVQDAELGAIRNESDIGLVCHRVVHGGDYGEPQTITEQTYQQLEKLVDLAPLHNGSAMAIVRCCFRLLPRSRNVACFDSQFHRTIPAHIATYPIDQQVASRNGLRKYGFHGLSYAFLTRHTALHLGKDADGLNIIALHLGSGASACAIKNGRSWDTSMGLTPASGLPGATRSGSIDPTLIFHYTNSAGKHSSSSTEKLHISHAEAILNTESGWRALAGTADFGVIATSDDHKHRLAFALVVDRICAFVGSYYVSLQGEVDALVFAGGIGAGSPELRRAVVDGVACLGFSMDAHANSRAASSRRTVDDLSGPGARRRVLACRVDEELEMARLCGQIS